MFVTNDVIFGTDTQTKLDDGIKTLYEAVSSTLGPHGRLCARQTLWGQPRLTKDGATVAKNIFLDDRQEQMGVEMVREAALRTCEEAGDGTTTSTILAYHLINRARECMEHGISPLLINQVFSECQEEALSNLDNIVVKVDLDSEKLDNVAYISSNEDIELSKSVIQAFREAGENAAITVEGSPNTTTYADVTRGFAIESGYLSPYFIGKDAQQVSKKIRIMDNPYIIVVPTKFSKVQQMTPLLGEVVKSGRPVVLFVQDMEGDSLALLIRNYHRGDQPPLDICVVKAPYQDEAMNKELFSDLATTTGATLIEQEHGIRLQDMKLKMLGSAKRVIVSADRTLVIEGEGDPVLIQARRDELNKNILEAADAPAQMVDLWKKRLSLFDGVVGVVKVGAQTSQQAEERKDRADDTVHAVRSALEEGVCPGGGLAWLRISQSFYPEMVETPFETEAAESTLDVEPTDEDVNITPEVHLTHKQFCQKSFSEAIQQPFFVLFKNAQIPDNVALQMGYALLNGDMKEWGYEFMKNGQFQAAENIRIYDPAKVLRCALRNAWSVAQLVLKTYTMITINDKHSNDDLKQKMIQQYQAALTSGV